MGKFLEFLNQNQGGLSLVFSAVVTVATVVYVILTRSLVRETIRLREVETEPEVSVYLEPSPRYLYVVEMVIRNIGHGPAYNVRFEYDENEPMVKRKWSFARVAFFQKGIAYMAPDQEIRIFLGTSIDLFNEPGLRPFDMVVHYETSAGQQREGCFRLDYRLYENLSRAGSPPDQEIARSLKEIADDLRRFAHGFRSLKVEVLPGQSPPQEESQSTVETPDSGRT